MNNSINYKIKKYQHKLAHASNQKEAALYEAKLNSYRNRQAGGNDEELRTEIKKIIDDNITVENNISLILNGLQVPFNDLVNRIVKECCKDKPCAPQVVTQIETVKENWRKLLEEISKDKNTRVSESLKNEIERIKKYLGELTCPPSFGSPALLEAAKKQAAAVQQMTQTAVAEATKPGEPSIPSATGEVGPEIRAEDLKGGLVQSPSPFNTEFSLFGSQEGGKRRKKPSKK